MEITDDASGEIRIEKVRIRYDFSLKYCSKCKLQGHDNDNCRILHPELIHRRSNVTDGDQIEGDQVESENVDIIF